MLDAIHPLTQRRTGISCLGGYQKQTEARQRRPSPYGGQLLAVDPASALAVLEGAVGRGATEADRGPFAGPPSRREAAQYIYKST